MNSIFFHLGYELLIVKDNCIYYGICRELNYSSNSDNEQELKNDFVEYVDGVL
jgi:hypothetical protein